MSQQKSLYEFDAITPSPDLIDELEAKHGRPIPAEAMGEAVDKIIPKASGDYQDVDQQTAEILAVEKDLARKDPIVKKVNRPAPDGYLEPRSGRQGKCLTCEECYRWHSRMPLNRAYCPECGDKLRATTYQNRWPWNIGIEPISCIEAWAKRKTIGNI